MPTTQPWVIENLFRTEYGRVLAALITHFGDFVLAEDALQEAFLIALEEWPQQGMPKNPVAWLTAVAKRRAIDQLRRGAKVLPDSFEDLQLSDSDAELDDLMMDEVPDERLKLMFTCCHPALSVESQVALTLQTLGGLSVEAVARAFLVPLSTMQQRLVRAKNKIRDAHIPYGIPPRELLGERLEALHSVLYLIFNEGYFATSETLLVNRELCAEAIRLCRILLELLPPENTLIAETTGLLALMLLHDSRRDARVNADGELVILEAQDRSLWHRDQIDEGIALLDTALTLRRPGPYQIQAAISALHAEARSSEETDWPQITALYGALRRYTASPVVELNYAVAMGMMWGPSEGLNLLLPLEEALAEYAPYHIACAEFLRKTHQREAAIDAYQHAIRLSKNRLERGYLQRQVNMLRLF